MNQDTWNGRAFDGSWTETAGGRAEVMEPATGGRLYEVGQANAEDIARAAKAASAAQGAWAATDPREKSAIFHRAANWLEENADELLRLMIRETGSIPPKAQVELREATAMLHLAGSVVLEPAGLVLPSVPGRTSLARRLPIGVVGVISPFNFPLILSMRAAGFVIWSLALGFRWELRITIPRVNSLLQPRAHASHAKPAPPGRRTFSQPPTSPFVSP